MMLATPLRVEDYNDYYGSLQPDLITVMNGKPTRASGNTFQIEPFTTTISGTPPPLQDTIPQTYGAPTDANLSADGDTKMPYGSPANYLLGAPTTAIPNLVAPGLTDKTGTQALGVPLDATILNNPTTEGLLTLQMPGSPLINNLQDQPATLNGSDPAQSPVTYSSDTAPPQPPLDTTETDNQTIHIAPGVDLKKSVLKETGIFIVGALILVVGIFALTR